MSRSVDGNLPRRSVVEAERAAESSQPSARPKALARPQIETQRFVPVTLERPAASEAWILWWLLQWRLSHRRSLISG